MPGARMEFNPDTIISGCVRRGLVSDKQLEPVISDVSRHAQCAQQTQPVIKCVGRPTDICAHHTWSPMQDGRPQSVLSTCL